ncbi:MAG TPA: hypothetical protein VJX66_31920 [Amycolatopsis sp.]|nr:hypothetical protein [Amycolatopsis sp.]
MTNRSHDWQTPPTEWAYDGRPMDEFEDPMLLAHERVRIRFGGDLPRDVSLALNEAYRRGAKETREAIAAEFEQVSGQRSPALSDEDNRRYSDIYASTADRIRHPEKYSGCAAVQDGYANAQAPKVTRAVDGG